MRLVTADALFRYDMFGVKRTSDPRTIVRYAVCLQQIGAYHEAFKLFEKLPFNELPEANLYYAVALFSQWEHEKSLPFLQHYVELPQLSSYQKLVGFLNLALAQTLTKRFEEAKKTLLIVEKEAEKNKNNLLLANTLEIRSQVFFEERDYKGALNVLCGSEKLLRQVPSKYKVMVEFQTAISEYGLNPDDRRASDKLTKLRKDAVAFENWPLVREIDTYRSIIDQDEELFLKVFFGTPFAGFRKKLQDDFGKKVKIPGQYLWCPFPGKKLSMDEREKYVIDVTAGTDRRTGAALKKGQAVHRLLQTLCSDFYVPFRPETIFSYIFPDDHYNPKHANNRASASIARLKKWIADNDIPFDINRRAGEFRMFATKPYSLLVRLSYDDAARFDVESEILKLLKDGKKRKISEMCSALGIPERTIYRKLENLLENKRVYKERKGYVIYYWC